MGSRPQQDDGQQDEEQPGRRIVPKVYAVFNAAQVEGWTTPAPTTVEGIERDQRADNWISATAAEISYGHNHAAYKPASDRIELPATEQFDDTESLYSTTLHELCHWTGRTSRLDRDLSGRFGDDAYAAEELVAELGAAIACNHLGVTPTSRDDHAHYLAHWLRVLKADPKALFATATRAQVAIDYLNGLQSDSSVAENDERGDAR